MRHRHRITRASPQLLGEEYAWDPYLSVFTHLGSKYATSRGIMGDSIHTVKHCYDYLHKGPPYKSGGPLTIWSHRNPYPSITNRGTYRGWIYKYEGGFSCNYTGSQLDVLSVESNVSGLADLDPHNAKNLGATAWRRFKPGQPSAELAVFLAESLDITRTLRSTAGFFKALWNRQKRSAKSLSGDWLSFQFGWLPFVSDCQKFYKTWQSLDKRINQLKRDNNQWIRRGGSIRKTQKSETVAESNSVHCHRPTLNPWYYDIPNYGSYKVTKSVEKHAWFSGRFKYYIPEINSVKWHRNAVRKLFGGSITPSVLYEATPWSWLVDWFSNTGDLISNLSGNIAENLVASHAYVMETDHVSLDVTSQNPLLSGPITDTWTFDETTKVRVVASPFGFGLDEDIKLSPRQFSILAALGISRR